MPFIPVLYACVALIRPANVLLAFTSVQIGHLCAGGRPGAGSALVAGLAMACICAGANAGNDYFDIDIDRRNRRDRPLVTGALSPKTALRLSSGFFIVGISLGAALSAAHFLIALIAVVASIGYNTGLKRRVIAGNLLVSATAATAFPYGGLLGVQPEIALIPAGFALLFHFGREILKDMEDMAGDRYGAVRSIPLQYGMDTSVRLIRLTFFTLIVFTFVPVYLRWFGMFYAALVIPVDLIILYALYAIKRNAAPVEAGKMSRILKIDMALGLLALCAGRL